SLPSTYFFTSGVFRRTLTWTTSTTTNMTPVLFLQLTSSPLEFSVEL
nr:hypothetical protein [Tanacetum cinerariifolium]